jgi:thiamine kinase-like enzyme
MKNAAVKHQSPERGRSDGSQIQLSGFSGAKVWLIREGDDLPFIRKISATPGGNMRLHEQAVKQRLMSGLLNGCATTPPILAEGNDENGLYYFDMQYVRGLDGISFLRSASLPKIAHFVGQLCECLQRLASLQDPVLRFSPRQNALAKCADILASIPPEGSAATRAVSRLIDILHMAPMPDEFPVTACHGDMTLENIVVSEAGDIVFIDLLDTFFNHWMADIAKLDQDLKAGWYMRKSQPLPVGVTAFVRRALAEFSRTQFDAAPEMVSVLVCVHLARILPYTRTAEDRQFVLGRLDVLLQQFPVLDSQRRYHL